ncbi:MAG TPA: FkbM family methyltransferase [Methylomirabilota bacterium]|nr:FkbM family methyltransferase [Methylomirabilota bacterium]
MGIGYAVGNVVLAARAYENWAEVITATAKRQEPATIILKNGLTIEAEMGLRFVVREIFFKRVYTPAYLPIEDNDIVVDIGANNGVFTIFAASFTHNAIHAFEPSPRNLEFLRRNIAVNKLHQVIVHDCAVSDKVGSAKLFINSPEGMQNMLSDHILPDKIEQYKTRTDVNYLILGADKSENYIKVPTTTLPEIMDRNNLDHIDFLKLDCEGAEGGILQSTSTAYFKRVRKIALEFHDHLSELDHSAIQKILERTGFTTRLKWNSKSPLGYIYAWRNQ